MRYVPFHQEEANFCIPACLQAVLKRRGIEPPTQQDIFSSFEIDESGVKLTETGLNVFLKEFAMSSRYEDPLNCFQEIDFMVEQALKRDFDTLIAYKYSKNNPHVSLLSEMHYPRIILQDPSKSIIETTFQELVESMREMDRRHGFYFII